MNERRLTIDPLRVRAVLEELLARSGVVADCLNNLLRLAPPEAGVDAASSAREAEKLRQAFDAEIGKLLEVCTCYESCERDINDAVLAMRTAVERS
ncbi:MAG: hypothetical protein IJL26_05680 [Clostridia bacterium]|nr:hypothetical protein [Clostridia bacterium]